VILNPRTPLYDVYPFFNVVKASLALRVGVGSMRRDSFMSSQWKAHLSGIHDVIGIEHLLNAAHDF
jgi:hypothetical protein